MTMSEQRACPRAPMARVETPSAGTAIYMRVLTLCSFGYGPKSRILQEIATAIEGTSIARPHPRLDRRAACDRTGASGRAIRGGDGMVLDAAWARSAKPGRKMIAAYLRVLGNGRRTASTAYRSLHERVEPRLRAVLADALGVAPEALEAETSLVHDLAADSLDLL